MQDFEHNAYLICKNIKFHTFLCFKWCKTKTIKAQKMPSLSERVQTERTEIAEQASHTPPCLSEGCLFKPVWSVQEWRESGSSLPWLNCSALTHYAHGSTQWTGPPESRFDILHSPSPYKPTWAALLLKSLKLSLICAPSVRRREAEEKQKKRKDEGGSMKLVGTHLTHLTLIQQSPASTHLRLPPNEASWLGWDCRGGPPRWLAWLLVLVQWLPRRSSWLDEIINCLF